MLLAKAEGVLVTPQFEKKDGAKRDRRASLWETETGHLACLWSEVGSAFTTTLVECRDFALAWSRFAA